jgi:hypothetical protein
MLVSRQKFCDKALLAVEISDSSTAVTFEATKIRFQNLEQHVG